MTFSQLATFQNQLLGFMRSTTRIKATHLQKHSRAFRVPGLLCSA